MPIPTTPTWLTPAEGATVDASTLLSWSASTVAPSAPVVAIVSPASGASITAGASFLIAATATDTTSATYSIDGGAAIALAYNSGSGQWEKSISLTGLGARTVTVTATGPGGTTTTPARNFTIAAAGTPAPTVTMVSPADGAIVTAGQPLLLAATGTDITALDFEVNDSGSMLPATWNASTSQWERTITPSTIATHTVNATATGDGGTTQSASVSFTVQASGGGSLMDSYITAVDAKRATLSQPALTTTEKGRLTEFWARLGNRDSEFSEDLTARLRLGLTLIAGQNAGSGTAVAAFDGLGDFTISGSPLPTWGAAGVTFPNGTGLALRPGGAFTGLTSHGSYIVAKTTTTTGNRYFLSQRNINLAAMSCTSGGNPTQVNVDSGGAAITTENTTGGGDYFGTRNAASFSRQDTVTRVRRIPSGAEKLLDTATMAGVTVNDTDTIVGNRNTGDRPAIAEVSIVLSFDVALSLADAQALHTLVRTTIGADLALPSV